MPLSLVIQASWMPISTSIPTAFDAARRELSIDASLVQIDRFDEDLEISRRMTSVHGLFAMFAPIFSPWIL